MVFQLDSLYLDYTRYFGSLYLLYGSVLCYIVWQPSLISPISLPLRDTSCQQPFTYKGLSLC